MKKGIEETGGRRKKEDLFSKIVDRSGTTKSGEIFNGSGGDDDRSCFTRRLHDVPYCDCGLCGVNYDEQGFDIERHVDDDDGDGDNMKRF
ncbi:hypothetical protein Lal_00029939 [Lupinus albus]|nr:hypothetical protein Lal_00029939 [Lupinus albus]